MPDQTRLLVVDDDADIRELLSAYLARYDMTVETAADGAGLFEKLDDLAGQLHGSGRRA